MRDLRLRCFSVECIPAGMAGMDGKKGGGNKGTNELPDHCTVDRSLVGHHHEKAEGSRQKRQGRREKREERTVMSSSCIGLSPYERH